MVGLPSLCWNVMVLSEIYCKNKKTVTLKDDTSCSFQVQTEKSNPPRRNQNEKMNSSQAKYLVVTPYKSQRPPGTRNTQQTSPALWGNSPGPGTRHGSFCSAGEQYTEFTLCQGLDRRLPLLESIFWTQLGDVQQTLQSFSNMDV